MFEKKTWVSRTGTGLNLYSIDGGDPVAIVNRPTSVSRSGDAFSSQNMNGMEQRIADAFDSGEVGSGAVVGIDSSGEKIGAIQLGEGTNNTPGTVQAYSYRLLNSDGTIPPERLTTIPEVNIVDNLDSTSNTSALSANQGRVLDETKANSADVYTKTQVDELLEDAGGGKAYSTIVIGTSTSGYTAPQVDYLCNGSNDSAQITAAVNALPDDGGQILLLEGRYRISSTISISKDNVTIRGMSENSILSIPSNNFNQITMFAVANGTSGLRFESLALDGLGGVEDNNPPYLAENTAGDTSPLSISFSNCLVRGFKNPCIKSALTDSVLENIQSDNVGGYSSGYSCINLQDNNIVSGCRDVAFTILGDSNRIIDCKIPYTVSQMAGGFSDFKVSGSYNRGTGCWINAKTEIGVEGSGSSSSYNIITGNWFYGNSFIATAINVYGTSIFAFNFYSSDYTLNSGAEVHALNNYTID